MRAFIALPISESIKEEIFSSLENARKEYPKLKWVPKNNYHLTLHFLGSISKKQLHLLISELNSFKLGSVAFKIKFGHFNAFPNLKRPSVIHLPIIEGLDRIKMIHEGLKPLLERANIPNETQRKFHPHLTLCRVKFKPENYNDSIFETILPPDGDIIDKIILFESDTSGKQPVYKPIQTIKL